MRAQKVRHFCTYFDKNYLSRGLTLYFSLRAHHPSFTLYVGCFDEETRAYLVARRLPDLVVLSQSELEAYDPELAAARSGRSRVEYFFTSTPSWLRLVLERFPEVELLTYVDADLCFFSSAEPLFDEMATAPIAVVEHRYPQSLAHLETLGRFNVGWLSFRREAQGLVCIDWWRERCIEWCFDRVEGGKYGDQKYLDQWPDLFPSLRVLQHDGANVGPWNVGARQVRLVGGQLRINGQPLVCFHFQGLKHVVGRLYESGLRPYGVRLDPVLRAEAFEPYLAQLAQHEAELAHAGLTSGHAKSQRSMPTGLSKLWHRATRAITVARLLLSRTYLLMPRAGRSSS